jgi:hypothetical protein
LVFFGQIVVNKPNVFLFVVIDFTWDGDTHVHLISTLYFFVAGSKCIGKMNL